MRLFRRETPNRLLVTGAQFWATSDGQVKMELHKGDDAGTSEIHNLADYDYGVIPWKVKTLGEGTITTLLNATVITCTTSSATTINASGGIAGQIVIFYVNNLTGGSVTFGTGFEDVGSALGLGRHTKIVFYDGSKWREAWRKVSPSRGAQFIWTFKMVSISDYATPVSGASPSITISKNGGAFTSLFGTPAVTEIGYGWYRVNVSENDTNADVIILRAIATGCAQTDRAIYL